MTKGIKTGGRVKGTPNKVTHQMRETLTLVLSKEIERLPELMEDLYNKERLFILFKLLPLVLPKPLNDLDEQRFIMIQRENESKDDTNIKEFVLREHLQFKCPKCHPDLKEFRESLEKDY